MKAIIGDILNGNTNEFRQIIQQYDGELLSIAYRFFNDWDTAKDVTQMTFISVYNNLRKYDTGKPFSPWIRKIHLNKCRNEYRKQAIRKKYEDLFIKSKKLLYSNEGEIQSILICMDTLPWKQKSAFILIEIEGYSSLEAAESLDCSDSTIRVNLKRAKEKLRKRLKQQGYNYE